MAVGTVSSFRLPCQDRLAAVCSVCVRVRCPHDESVNAVRGNFISNGGNLDNDIIEVESHVVIYHFKFFGTPKIEQDLVQFSRTKKNQKASFDGGTRSGKVVTCTTSE